MSQTAQRWAYSVADLSTTERIVLVTIAWHHNPKTGECYPAMSRLATETGLSPGHVRKVVRELEKRNLLTTIRGGGRWANSYALVGLPRVQDAGSSRNGTRKSSSTPRPGRAQPKDVNQTSNDDTSPSPSLGRREGDDGDGDDVSSDEMWVVLSNGSVVQRSTVSTNGKAT